MSERIPVRGLHQILSSFHTTLHLEPKASQYLSYTDVPWWLDIRKEVFSPSETLSNPKTIDLIFYQIVRDVLQRPSIIRIPANGRQDMKRLLGELTAFYLSFWKVVIIIIGLHSSENHYGTL